MDEYIEREAALNVCEMHYQHCLMMHDYCGDTTADNIKTDIETIPAADVVSKSLYDQIKWERDTAISQLESYGVGLGEKADVKKVRHRNTDDKSCVICNSELDESETGGLWDLAAEICNELYGYLNYCDEQDTVYNLIRNYIERENYCPNCGAKMDGKEVEGE